MSLYLYCYEPRRDWQNRRDALNIAPKQFLIIQQYVKVSQPSPAVFFYQEQQPVKQSKPWFVPVARPAILVVSFQNKKKNNQTNNIN